MCRFTNISEKPAAFIFPFLPYRQKQQVPPKHWYISTELHGITLQKAIMLMLNLSITEARTPLTLSGSKPAGPGNFR
jgi:hypothetical protein